MLDIFRYRQWCAGKLDLKEKGGEGGEGRGGGKKRGREGGGKKSPDRYHLISVVLVWPSVNFKSLN